MQITTTVRTNRGETIEIPLTIDEPLSNEAGHIIIGEYGPSIEIDLDDRARAAGIKWAKAKRLDSDRNALLIDSNIKDRVVGLGLDGRPALVALIDNKAAIDRQIQAARDDYWAPIKAAEHAADEAMRVEMRAEAARIAEQIPAGNIRVTVTKTGDFDGYPTYDYHLGEMVIPGHLARDYVTIHGHAGALRPGALNWFDQIAVASISPANLEVVKAEIDKLSKKAEADKARNDADFAQRAAASQTPQAIADLRRYGTAESAWEAGDEMAWARMREYTDFEAFDPEPEFGMED